MQRITDPEGLASLDEIRHVVANDLPITEPDKTRLLDAIETRRKRPWIGAQPGQAISHHPYWQWTAYGTEAGIVAACYLDGHLLRRDLAGWWTATYLGQREPVEGDMHKIAQTVPDGWLLHPEQGQLR